MSNSPFFDKTTFAEGHPDSTGNGTSDLAQTMASLSLILNSHIGNEANPHKVTPSLINAADSGQGTKADTALQPSSPLAAANLTGTIDPARIPVMFSGVQVVSSGDLTALTPAQLAEITQGAVVTTSDGSRYVYTGTGDKTLAASYIILADVTPDWSVIANKPAFKAVATSGSYTDLTNTPALGSAASHAASDFATPQATKDAFIHSPEDHLMPSGFSLVSGGGGVAPAPSNNGLYLRASATSPTTAGAYSGAYGGAVSVSEGGTRLNGLPFRVKVPFAPALFSGDVFRILIGSKNKSDCTTLDYYGFGIEFISPSAANFLANNGTSLATLTSTPITNLPLGGKGNLMDGCGAMVILESVGNASGSVNVYFTNSTSDLRPTLAGTFSLGFTGSAPSWSNASGVGLQLVSPSGQTGNVSTVYVNPISVQYP